jgi:hypothetical protein
MARLSLAKSDSDIEEVAPAQAEEHAQKPVERMDVDGEDEDASGEEDAEEEEYEIEAILDAKKGSFPNVWLFFSLSYPSRTADDASKTFHVVG